MDACLVRSIRLNLDWLGVVGSSRRALSRLVGRCSGRGQRHRGVPSLCPNAPAIAVDLVSSLSRNAPRKRCSSPLTERGAVAAASASGLHVGFASATHRKRQKAIAAPVHETCMICLPGDFLSFWLGNYAQTATVICHRTAIELPWQWAPTNCRDCNPLGAAVWQVG